MFIKFTNVFLIFYIYSIFIAVNGIPTPKTVCPLEKSCGKVKDSSAVCIYDDKNGCIRKFKSKCHLDVAACREGKKYTDFSDLYCSMESFICEASVTYARWTIFHGYE